MEINRQILEKLSRLSAIRIAPEEEKEMQAFLTQVLSHFKKIKEINTEGVPPLFSPLKSALFLRADKVESFKDKDKLLEQSPKKQGALIKAPSAL